VVEMIATTSIINVKNEIRCSGSAILASRS
jgi:hypothetical protein